MTSPHVRSSFGASAMRAQGNVHFAKNDAAEGMMDMAPSLKGLDKTAWLSSLSGTVTAYGQFQRLGQRHISVLVEKSNTLLVTFETYAGIQTLSETAHPLGWRMVEMNQWSHMAVISDGDTWFRDPAVYAYFDHLADTCFFDEFDQVVFYGAGPCGYAAAAFSVAAPGSRLLLVQPQATLEAGMTEWDPRFPELRRADFRSRYGYAPDMIEAADHAYIVYDPHQTEDAMHATLFQRPNVTRLRMPMMGASLQTDLLDMYMLEDMLDATHDGTLTVPEFAFMARARRTHMPYLRRLLTRLEHQGRDDLIEILCQWVTRRMAAPRFEQKLRSLHAS